MRVLYVSLVVWENTPRVNSYIMFVYMHVSRLDSNCTRARNECFLFLFAFKQTKSTGNVCTQST